MIQHLIQHLIRPLHRCLNPQLLAATSIVAAIFSMAACGGGNGATPEPAPRPTAGPHFECSGSVVSAPAGLNCATSCSAVFANGAAPVLTATPTAGQVFAAWGGDCSGTSPSCTLAMDRDRNVTATFAAIGANSFALGVSIVGSGSVTSQPAGISCGSTCAANFAAGSSVTLTAAATGGQVFSGWTGSCSATPPAAR